MRKPHYKYGTPDEQDALYDELCRAPELGLLEKLALGKLDDLLKNRERMRRFDERHPGKIAETHRTSQRKRRKDKKEQANHVDV